VGPLDRHDATEPNILSAPDRGHRPMSDDVEYLVAIFHADHGDTHPDF
jgi:hypothetical protein